LNRAATDMPSRQKGTPIDVRGSYLRLLKLALTGAISPQPFTTKVGREGLVFPVPLAADDMDIRIEGRDRPLDGYTMVGLRRLDNLQTCVEDVLANGIPGDLVDAGTWRGGTAIMMRSVLKLHGGEDRMVYAADAFGGSAPAERVERNLRRLGVFDGRLELIDGPLEETLPRLSGRAWSVARMAVDSYERTTSALESLYPGISPGGYLVIDDYGASEQCRRAVHDYRDRHQLREEIQTVDWSGVYWQKPG
jgi:hypothetical protein